MPSPTWSTVPTSARSVSTSKSLIRSLRMAVISSGRSFTVFLSGSGDEFSLEAFQAVAHARIHAQRAGLEDDAADQVGVDRTRRLDGPAGGLLDLLDDRAGLVLGEVEGRGQLDGELPLLAGGEPVELLADLLDLPAAAFLDQKPQEVADERVGVARDGIHGGELRPLVELGVAQDLRELRHLTLGLDEVAELLSHLCELPPLLRGLEQRPRVRAMNNTHVSRSAPPPRSRGR